MKNKNWATKLTTTAAVALMLSGCAGASMESVEEPATEAPVSQSSSAAPESAAPWSASVSQSPDVDAAVAAALDSAEPQFSYAGYEATIVPLGESVEGDKKVRKFALKADLPENCNMPDGVTTNPDVNQKTCLGFIYSTSGPVVPEAGQGGSYRPDNDGGIEYLETIKGSSIIQITSPLNTETTLVTILAAGTTVMLDPMTGKVTQSRDTAAIGRA